MTQSNDNVCRVYVWVGLHSASAGKAVAFSAVLACQL